MPATGATRLVVGVVRPAALCLKRTQRSKRVMARETSFAVAGSEPLPEWEKARYTIHDPERRLADTAGAEEHVFVYAASRLHPARHPQPTLHPPACWFSSHLFTSLHHHHTPAIFRQLPTLGSPFIDASSPIVANMLPHATTQNWRSNV
ncbi:hypothetical protein BST61_g8192 [Cercospora zeina]